jgi:hypothetical protein
MDTFIRKEDWLKWLDSIRDEKGALHPPTTSSSEGPFISYTELQAHHRDGTQSENGTPGK